MAMTKSCAIFVTILIKLWKKGIKWQFGFLGNIYRNWKLQRQFLKMGYAQH